MREELAKKDNEAEAAALVTVEKVRALQAALESEKRAHATENAMAKQLKRKKKEAERLASDNQRLVGRLEATVPELYCLSLSCPPSPNGTPAARKGLRLLPPPQGFASPYSPFSRSLGPDH